MIEPVGLLELELWTADGAAAGRAGPAARRAARALRIRPHRPGTAREASCPRATYVLRLRAHSVDGDDGTPPSTAEAVFTIVP